VIPRPWLLIFSPLEVGMYTLFTDWLMSGSARFAVHNASGDYYPYRVRKLRNGNRGKPRWLVDVLTSPGVYSYTGCLNPVSGRVSLTCGTYFTDDSVAFRVLNWAMRVLWSDGVFPPGYGICGEDRCSLCGGSLTLPADSRAPNCRAGLWKHTCPPPN